jgi:hypothetical protein
VYRWGSRRGHCLSLGLIPWYCRLKYMPFRLI